MPSAIGRRRLLPRPVELFCLTALLALLATATPALDPERAIGQHAFRFWSLDDGLPHATVRSITQTSDGYLWLATYDGLVRFDGREFQIFDRSTRPWVRSPTVLAVLESRGGDFWIGSNGGLTRWTTASDRKVAVDGPVDTGVYALCEGPDGEVWIATNGAGLFAFRGETVEHWGPEQGLPHANVQSLALEPDGTLWVGTHGGLARLRDGQLEVVDALAGESIHAILWEEDEVWVGSDLGLHALDPSGTVSAAELPGDRVTALLRDHNGLFWVGTYARGLLRRRHDGWESFGVEAGLPDPSIRALFEDGEGALWVGTNGGLIRIGVGAFLPWGTNEGLPDDYVRAILPEGERLWVATARGLARLDPTRGVDLVLGHEDGLPGDYVMTLEQEREGGLWVGTTSGLARRTHAGRIESWTRADGLPHDVVRAIVDADDGPVWIGTDGGLATLDAIDGRFRPRPELLPNPYVMAMGRDDSGSLWVATDGGGLVEIRENEARVVEGLPTPHVLSLLVTPEGRVWAGTDGGGLAIVEHENGEDPVTRVLTSRQGIVHDKITQVFPDGQGNVWLGSSRGLVRLDEAEALSAARGEIATVRATRYGRGDGLRSSQLNGATQPPAARDTTGRLWFATAKGVVSTTPELLASRSRDEPPRTVLESLRVDGQPVDLEPTVAVPAGTRRFEVRWTAQEFAAPDQVTYRYRLEPRDPDWVDMGSARGVTFRSPEPGAARLRVESSLDGVHWSAAVPIDITVRPHLLERPSFRGLLAALGLGLILGAHRLRTRKLHRQRSELESRVAERTEEIRAEKARAEAALAQAERHEAEALEARAEAEKANRTKSIFLATTSHELRTPLTAILGFSELLLKGSSLADRRSRRFVENIYRSGTDLLGLINNLLDLTKIEADRMPLELAEIEIRDLVREVAEQLRGILLPAGVALEQDFDEPRPVRADPEKVRRILVNLISNAVKFSPEGGTVIVRTRHLEAGSPPQPELWIEVEDRGPGIAPEEQERVFEAFQQAGGGSRPRGTGLGLAIVRHLVEMHDGRIELESEVGRGSTFIVRLPGSADNRALASSA